ncbi:MAG TPA: hypothetical protein V6C85_26790 [Allocoleopsis sp.]
MSTLSNGSNLPETMELNTLQPSVAGTTSCGAIAFKQIINR